MYIILLILKIIGWILLILLGLVVLTVCLILFTPLKYQASAKCDGTLSDLAARVDFSIFFHLIRGYVSYIEQQISWELRLAWKRMGTESEQEEPDISPQETSDSGKDVGENDAEVVNAEEINAEETGTEEINAEETEEAVSVEEDAADSQENGDAEQHAATVPETVDAKQDAAYRQEEVVSVEEVKVMQEKAHFTQSEKETDGSPEKEEKESVFSKFAALAEKLKCTCREICDKIKELLRKKELLTDFLTDDAHKAAWKKLLAEGKKLLKRLLPKKFQADIRFGFEDPALTGKVLAGVSMVYPMICEHAEICPDFHQQILKGNLYIKGKIRVVTFAVMLWNMLLDSNVRRTVTDIRNFKF